MGCQLPAGKWVATWLIWCKTATNGLLIWQMFPGHGVPSGVLMAMVKSAVRMRLATSSEPQVLLEDLNRVISELIAAEMFVTLALRIAREVE